MAIATKKIINIKGEMFGKRVAEEVTSKIAMRLICIPGKRPVKQPKIIPQINATRSSKIMKIISNREIYSFCKEIVL